MGYSASAGKTLTAKMDCPAHVYIPPQGQSVHHELTSRGGGGGGVAYTHEVTLHNYVMLLSVYRRAREGWNICSL